MQNDIIGYYKKFQDATGHFDLWTGTGFIGSSKLSDVRDGFSAALWCLGFLDYVRSVQGCDAVVVFLVISVHIENALGLAERTKIWQRAALLQ